MDDEFDPDDLTDEEWENEMKCIMNNLYPEGYDPDIDGCIYDYD